MTEFKPDHAALTDLIAAAALPYSPAETHGIQCGMLCAGVGDWKGAILGDADPGDPAVQTALDRLEALRNHSAKQLSQGQTPLELLLPGENRPSLHRATAIRDWCQGFLYGFGLGGQQSTKLLQSDAGEALRDFGEIAQLDLSDFDEGEEAEEALMQLQEYLWVATSLIWFEIND